MALLNSRYHCHGSPYIITVQPRPINGLDQWAGSFQANNPQRCWNGWGREENAKCATSSGDWHKASCLPAPQRFTSFHCCPSLSCSLSFLLSCVPHLTPTILLVCDGTAWSGYYPTLLLRYWSASSLLLFSLSSLHSPLHWFHLSLWAHQLGVITHTAHTQWYRHAHTHAHNQTH